MNPTTETPERAVYLDSAGNERELWVQPELTEAAVAKLRDNLEFITRHRARWDQETWMEVPEASGWSRTYDAEDEDIWAKPFERPAELGSTGNCGATGCLAGWVVLRDPEIPLVQDDSGTVYPARWDTDTEAWDTSDYGDTGYTAERALGLYSRNASQLFAGRNTLRDLWRMTGLITAGRIEVPEEFR